MRIAVFHASAGHGHQKAAEAVREGFLACGLKDSEILLRDVLDETPAWFKSFYTSTYYYSVRHTPRLWGATYRLTDQMFVYRTLVRPLRRCVNDLIARRFVDLLLREKPDAIICTHFLSPEVTGRLKAAGRLNSLLVTVVTDFLPHSFWVNPGTDHYWVMSEEGKRELLHRSVPGERVTSGGIPILLRFRPEGKKDEIRKREGLELNRFTILVTSGSFGLGPTEEVLSMLHEFSPRIQAIVVCGRNEDQRQALARQTSPFPMKLYGFVSHMDELMEASDLLIAKPGGATTAESLAKGVPMVVLKPIPGQEGGNARLLKERNAAFFLGEPRDIRTIVKGILDCPQVLEEKRQSIRRLAKPEAAIDLARFVISRLEKGRA